MLGGAGDDGLEPAQEAGVTDGKDTHHLVHVEKHPTFEGVLKIP